MANVEVAPTMFSRKSKSHQRFSNEPANETEIKYSIPVFGLDLIVFTYTTLLVVGAVGNLILLASLMRSRRRKSRVSMLMTHLTVADMAVIFIVIPLEIGWRTTNEWLAGNIACKMFLVLRAFGLYLSSNVIVCISLDRFFAFLYPLKISMARKRSKIMLCMAWIVAILCSLPQSLVFHVMTLAKTPDFEQCVSFDTFANRQQESVYNVCCLIAVYFLPLLIISVCYPFIYVAIEKKSKEDSGKESQSNNSRVMLRRSDQRPLARARRRTLRMAVTIVIVFACCWLPYAIMTLWYMIDRKSAVQVPPWLQYLFFIMAVSNSCMNPLVYGFYTINRKTIKRTFRKVFCLHVNPSEIPGVPPLDIQRNICNRQRNMDTILQHDNECVPCGGLRHIRFEESSPVGGSVNSDPIQYEFDCSAEDGTVQSARGEIFALHTLQLTTEGGTLVLE